MVSANGIYTLKVIGTVATQQHQHTMAFRTSADPTVLAYTEPAAMQAIITAWQAGPRSPYRQLFGGTDNPVQSYQVRKVCGTLPLPAGLDLAESAGNQAGTGVAGEYTGDTAAPWLASVMTLRTGYAGRRYRGRWYFGGLYEAMMLQSNVSTARQTAMTAYATSMTTAFINATDLSLPFHLFVYSKTIATEAPATPCQQTGADVTSFQARAYLCTMKSRKIGSGI